MTRTKLLATITLLAACATAPAALPATLGTTDTRDGSPVGYSTPAPDTDTDDSTRTSPPTTYGYPWT